MKTFSLLAVLALLGGSSPARADDMVPGAAPATETAPATGTPATETANETETAPTGEIPAATKEPQVGSVSKTLAVQLDGKESQDFNLDLPKGQFFVYLDARRDGEGSIVSNIDATLSLLKRNGAQFPQFGSSLIYWNSRDSTSRVGKPFAFAAPTGVRFRVKNESDGINTFWLTVVPATPVTFLPFGFGSTLTDAKIGPNNGTGSTLEHREFEYLRAKIPAGKWSVSLGAKSEAGRCYVSMSVYNERGVDYPAAFSIFGVDSGERKEENITLAKPTTLIFRVHNEGAADTNTVTYDVTIEPAGG